MSSRSTRKTNFLPLLLVGVGLIALIGAGILLSSMNGEQTDTPDAMILPPIEVDQPAPELTLYDLDGNQVSLSDFKGQVVLLNNWATWCPPCRREMPEIQAYYAKYHNQGFQVIAVDAGQPEEEVRSFVEEQELEFLVLLDPEKKSLLVFQNDYLPSSYVIDRQGHLRLVWTGEINEPTLEKYVTPLLEE